MQRKWNSTSSLLVIFFLFFLATNSKAHKAPNIRYYAKASPSFSNRETISSATWNNSNIASQIFASFTEPTDLKTNINNYFFKNDLRNNPTHRKNSNHKSLKQQINPIISDDATSSIATLSNLTVNIGSLSPAFSSGNFSYFDYVTNASGSITVTPTLTDPTATVKVNGIIVTSGTASTSIPLSIGDNTILTVVTAQDGITKQTYTLTVNRAASSVATLTGLAISSGTLSPSFNSGITSYTDNVINTTNSIKITPTLTDATATVTVNGIAVTSGTASQSISLNTGTNTITTVVTAQDGTTTQTYTIIVTRSSLSAVNTLNSLTVSSGILSPVFNSGTYGYTDYLPNSVSSITITPTLSDPTASMTVNGVPVISGMPSNTLPLLVGNNTITTAVTAQDGITKQNYTITVIVAPTGSALLSNMVVSAGTLSPAFSASTNTYTEFVPNSTSSITITPTVNVPNATITVNGNPVTSGSASSGLPLAVGNNTITVVVTAQSGSPVQTYTITVNRANSNIATLSGLSPSIGALTPAFSSGTNSYTDNVSNTTTSITVTPTVTDATATVVINGIPVSSGFPSSALPLVVGNNIITTVVTAQDGITKQTYTITAKRAASNVATLSNLGISGGTLSPTFTPTITSYTDVVSNATSSITLTPAVTDGTATVTVNGVAVTSGTASNALPLVYGNNTITTVVTAQDGSTKQTYTIIVNRPALTIATLNSLAISSGTLSPIFATGTTSYIANVSNATSTIAVTPTVTDNTATVTVNGIAVLSGSPSGAITLTMGGNTTITTVVTAQDGITKQTYTVVVYRAASSIATLSSLNVSTGTISPVFLNNTYAYTDIVSNTTTGISVTPIATDATATITVNGVVVASGFASNTLPLSVGNNTIAIIVTAQDGITKQTYNLTVYRTPLTIATLSSLSLSSGSLSPTFNSGTSFYTSFVTNSINSITATPIVSDASATVTINGTAVVSGTSSTAIPLVVGNNTITVIVTAQDGITKQTYTVLVNRPLSAIASLGGLAISSGTISPTFSSSNFSYNDNVTNANSNITITPTAADATSTITVNGTLVSSGSASASLPLLIGSNIITIIVTAQDGITKQTYTITVTRPNSNVATLSALSISNGTLSPIFATNTTSYSASVLNSTSSITITPTLTDPTAAVTVNGITITLSNSSAILPLNIGNNTISTVVTAQDGITKQTYNVIVNRAPSTIATLNSLAISGGALSPAFSGGVYSYTDNVPNATSSITVTPTSTDANAAITVNGAMVSSGSTSTSIPLSIGNNTITTIITAQDGITKQTYTIQINRALSSDATLGGLVVSNGYLSPAFNSRTTTYIDNVSNATDNITVTPVLTDANASLTVNGVPVISGTLSNILPLLTGINTIAIVVKAQDGVTIQTYTLTIIRADVAVSTLGDLGVSSGTLSPAFSSGNLTYTDNVTNATNSIIVTPVLTDAAATVTVNGTPVVNNNPSSALPLSLGNNIITVVVTSQDGKNQQTYSLTVNRPKSSVSTLKNLIVSGGTNLVPGFNSSINSYNYDVANTTNSITVTPTVTDATATITVNGATVVSGTISADLPIAVGPNPIAIVVTAQDGSTNTYTVNVNRAASSGASLTGLGINNGTLSPSFSSGTISYEIKVPNETDNITVTPQLADATSTVTVNGKAVVSNTPSQIIALAVGRDTITTVVTAQDNSTKQTYTIYVTRESSTNATLSNLLVTSGNLNLVSSTGTINYIDNVQSSTKLIALTPALSDLNAKVKVTVGGNLTVTPNGSSYIINNLITGNNTITITVTAQDGITQQTYIITVKQAPPGTNTLSDLSVSNGTLNPIFDSNVYTYNETVPNTTTSLKLTPTANDSHAQISLNGTTVISGLTTSPVRLNLGLNTINIKVTAQDGTSQTYVLTVNRIPSRIATLDDIAISGGTLTPGFDSGDTSFTANVSNSVGNISVKPVLTDAFSSATVNGLPVIPGSAQNIALNAVGYTNITTVVTAQDGVTQQTYNLLVNRAPAGDSILYSLLVSKGRIAPVFESDTSNYVDNVTNNTKTITITPKANNPNATISINGTQLTSTNSNYDGTLTVGNNNFNIIVTAPNLSTKQYNLKVNRAPLGSALLGSLFLTCLPKDTSFKSTTLSYTYNVPNNITSTRLLIAPNDSTSDMYIIRQNTTNVLPELVDSGRLSQPILLSAGTNTVKILVTAQNGTSLTYTLTIIRAQSADNALSNLSISGASAFKFDTAKYSYDNIYLDNDTYTYVSVTPTEHDINTTASITVNGQAILSGNPTNSIPIISGVNKISIVVTAQNGNARTYTVMLYKRPLLTDVAILDMHNVNISNKSLNPAFYATTFSYIDTVSSSNINIYVSPTFNGCTALVNGKSVTSGNQSQAIPLTPGYNKISVILTSLDGATTNTYNISAYRPASNNNLLSNLTISSGSITPAFDTNTTGYTTTVNYDINSITVTPTVVGPNASITVNNTSVSSGSSSGSIPLLVGPNTITTKVIAEDGVTINNYSIIIIRNPQTQTFTFDPLMAVNFGDPDLTLKATVSSKQPIKYTSSNPTIATIDTLTNTVHFIGVGTVTITAKVKSNNQYFPVDSISRQLVINKGNQTIENTQIPVFIKGDQYDLSKIFSASSKLPISSFIVLNHELDSIKSSNYIPLQLGTDSIIVIQNGNSLYNATRKSFEITISDAANDEIVTHQFVTPNGDGINDYLVIEGIQQLNNNTVKIINRNGVVVYSSKNYDNEKIRFDGHSGNGSEYLPSGTYFYIIDYTNTSGVSKQKTGFFLLKF